MKNITNWMFIYRLKINISNRNIETNSTLLKLLISEHTMSYICKTETTSFE